MPDFLSCHSFATHLLYEHPCQPYCSQGEVVVLKELALALLHLCTHNQCWNIDAVYSILTKLLGRLLAHTYQVVR